MIRSMMIRPIFAIATLLAAVHLQGVAAADLGAAPAPVEVPQSDTMNLFGTGWYIRGDLGYSRPQGPSGSYNGVPFSHLSLGDSAVVGGGVGYKISNWFRADVTADYKYGGLTHATYTVPNCCVVTDRTRLGGWTVLANGYVDLGTWYSVTPYVGGGIGYAFTHITSSFVTQPDPNTGLPLTTPYPPHTTGGFAWALAAGAAIDVTPSVKIDLGYRYLNIADARMAVDNNGVTPSIKSLGAHQFRVGVRYMFEE